MAEALAGASSILPLFAISSVISICFFLAAPTLLSRMGNSLFFFILGALQAGSLLLLAINPDPITSTLALVIHMASLGPLGFALDLFLERATDEFPTVGSVRGAFLTAGNMALVISPIIAGFILEIHSFSFMYGLTLFVFCFFFLISLPMLEHYKDPVYSGISLRGIKKALTGSLSSVMYCQLILRIFFSWMAILLPLYLHQSLGFAWQEVGIILTCSLLPFVVFEAPVGFLIDRFFIVRPTVLCGFLILGGATALLAMQNTPTILLVISLLFISRIGAAMIEIGTEAYFFKQVQAKEEDAIMVFRIVQPFGYLCGTAIASALLLFMNLNDGFMLFGIAMIAGAVCSLHLRSTTVQETISPLCRGSNLRC